MNTIKEAVNEFLKMHGMAYQDIDLEEYCSIFIDEMDRGISGKDSSLQMIPTYINPDISIHSERPVIVIDAGGTNLRVALVQFNFDESPSIKYFKTYAMPGSKGPITKVEFYNAIVDCLEPILAQSQYIGFCFSYPTQIMPNLDGKLIRFCKEVQVTDMEGELIGFNLMQTIKERGYSDNISVVILNDTVATLLSGMAGQSAHFNDYIGFILGTGTNTCYIEKCSNIKKVISLMHSTDSMIVNIESGAYNKVARGSIDLNYDKSTINPNEYVFEKMISGGYQAGLLLAIIRQAGADGLLSKKFMQNIDDLANLNTKDIDDFLYYPKSSNKLANCCKHSDEDTNSRDCMTLFYLIDALLERAAKLVVVNISSVIIKTGQGKNPCEPVCIIAEGTTFYKSKLMREKLNYYIKSFLVDQKELYCEFVKVEDATIVGSAIAALSGMNKKS